MDSSASEFCRGARGTCECEIFYPSSGNDRICQECQHGRSKHGPNTSNGTQSDPPPPMKVSYAAPKLPPPASSCITEVFNGMVADPFVDGTQKQPSHMSAATAKAEVLAASRDRAVPPIQRVTNKRQMSVSKRTASGSHATPIFHVQSIGLNIGGIDSDGRLLQVKAPHGVAARGDIQELKNRGCYIEAAPGSENGIAINSSWTFLDIDNKLRREWFPRVFDYIEAQRPRGPPYTQAPSSMRSPEWCLLIKQSSIFRILEVMAPNGSTLFENKGRLKAKISDSHLWFATKKAIPLAVYNSWRSVVIAGSDPAPASEDLSDDEIASFGDDQDYRDYQAAPKCSNIEVDDSLSSPMQILDISDDSDNFPLQIQGKGKAPVPKTPPRHVGKRSRVIYSPVSPSSPVVLKRMKGSAGFELTSEATSSSLSGHHIFGPIHVPQVTPAPTMIPFSEVAQILQDRSSSPISNLWVTSDGQTGSTYTLPDYLTFCAKYLDFQSDSDK